jgi:ATP-dependent protease HslVU (ClpYQ) ATPase subunit
MIEQRPKQKTLTIKKVTERRYNKRDVEDSIRNLTDHLAKLEEELEQWKLRRDILSNIDEKNEEIIVEEKYKGKVLDTLDVVDETGELLERKYVRVKEEVKEEVIEEPEVPPVDKGI